MDKSSEEKNLELPEIDFSVPNSRTVNIPVGNLPHKRREGYISTYSNTVGFAVNPWDIRMVFGVMEVNENAQTGFVQDECGVAMSWEHALALSEALKRAIAEYERTQGPIRRTAIQHLLSPKE